LLLLLEPLGHLVQQVFHKAFFNDFHNDTP
jgi:hypothetical protein